MASQVLITGATGHVGAAVLIKALQEGYSVRAAIRSLSSKEKILDIPSIRDGDFHGRLSFVEVPDILAAGAYNEAIKDVDYVIHVASPIPVAKLAATDLNQTVVAPAIRGTLNILEAARTNPKIKRVVVTSSVVANTNIDDPQAVASPHTREPIPEYSDLSSAYRASKHAALLASDVFMAEHQPQFDLINVMPSYVIGQKQLADSPADVLSGSNRFALMLLTNGVAPFSMPGSTIHLDDVALVHVKALQLEGKANRNFGLTTDFDPNAVLKIAQDRFPKAFEEGKFKTSHERQQFHLIKWDASETEKTFGIKFKSVEEQIVPVAQQYLELQSAA